VILRRLFYSNCVKSALVGYKSDKLNTMHGIRKSNGREILLVAAGMLYCFLAKPFLLVCNLLLEFQTQI
jgi:hypothetical protein